jgi:hypothetical protein
MKNIDEKTVASFGDEWSRFDQSGMSNDVACRVFNEYFAMFPWDALSSDTEGFDMGFGSGLWAFWVSPKVGKLRSVCHQTVRTLATRWVFCITSQIPLPPFVRALTC